MEKSRLSKVCPRNKNCLHPQRKSCRNMTDFHQPSFRLHPWSNHGAAHGTGGKTDTRITTYPFDLPSVRESVDIQDAMIFSKPYRGLDWRPIPFETLQIEISLTREWGKALARHGTTFMLDTGGMCACHSVPGIGIPSMQHTAVGERYGRANRDESLHTPIGSADADG